VRRARGFLQRTGRVYAIAIAIAAGIAVAATVGGPLIATPEAQVAEIAVGVAGSATVALSNVSSSTQNVVSIVQDPADCDDPTMTVTPQSFAVASGSMQNVAFACSANGSATMERCLYHVENSSGSDLTTFLGVCESSTAAELSASPSTVSFPPVAVGSSAVVTVALTNLGSNAGSSGTFHLQLTDLEGDFLIGTPCNPNVNGCDLANAALGSADIDIICAPSSASTFTGSLYVVDSLGDRLTAPVQLSCTGTAGSASTPSIHVSTTPSPLDLRTVAVLGGTGSGNVHITNVGTSVLTITTIAINGAGNDWTFALGSTCSSLPCGISAGSALDVGIHFAPSAIGTRDATMAIVSNDPAQSEVVVQLAGIGGGGTLALAPSQPAVIDLGDVAKTGSAAVAIELVNGGDQTLSGVALSLAGAPQFTITPATSVDLPPGLATQVMLTCQPAGATGAFTTTFTAMAADAVGSSTATVNATCHGTTSALLASPPSLALGQLFTSTVPGQYTVTLKSSSASTLTLNGTPTVTDSTAPLTVVPLTQLTIPAMGSANVTVQVDAGSDATIATTIVATDTNGDTVTIPVTGTIATANFTVPAMVSAGTFCVGQPTTPTTIALTTLNTVPLDTATIELPSAPTMASVNSPFSLAPASPLVFPANIGAGSSALVDVIPNRQRDPVVVTDTLQWATNLPGMMTIGTPVTATFLGSGSGAAIAPASLVFGPFPPHLFVNDAQSVMIQNCNGSTITLVPSIDPPFSIGADFPTALTSGATANFGVSFEPPHPGTFTGMLTIATSATANPLTVSLTGVSATTTPVDAGSGSGSSHGDTSFYACSCTTGGPLGGWPIVLAIIAALWSRRVRPRRVDSRERVDRATL
jgi:hypothetical protein